MQCPICEFENMTGVSTCGRCGALFRLDESVGRGDFVPPRASGFTRFHSLAYLMNRIKDAYGSTDKAGRGIELPGDGFVRWSVLLSTLPGLGHLVDGRGGRAAAAFGVWFLLVCLTVIFYGGTLGTIMGCLVLTWHWAVLVDACRIHGRVEGFRSRLTLVLIFFVACCVAYFSISRLATRYVAFVHSPFSLQALDIREGDALLIRPESSFSFAELTIGDILDVKRKNIAVHGVDFLIRPRTIARVVALEDDSVHLSSEGVEVNGTLLEAEDLPDGELPLPENPFSFIVAEGRILVVCPLDDGGGWRRGDPTLRDTLCRRIWIDGFMVGDSDIRGRAAGVYQPISRRHFWNGGTGM